MTQGPPSTVVDFYPMFLDVSYPETHVPTYDAGIATAATLLNNVVYRYQNNVSFVFNWNNEYVCNDILSNLLVANNNGTFYSVIANGMFHLPDGTPFTVSQTQQWYEQGYTAWWMHPSPLTKYAGYDFVADATELAQHFQRQETAELNSATLNCLSSPDVYDLGFDIVRAFANKIDPALLTAQAATGLSITAMRKLTGLIATPFTGGSPATECPDQFSKEFIQALAPDVLDCYVTLMTFQNHNSISDATFAKFTDAQQMMMITNHTGMIQDVSFARFSNATMAALTATEILSFSLAQLHCFSAPQCSQITPQTIADLKSAISRFTPAQLAGLVPAQLININPINFQALSPDQQMAIMAAGGAGLSAAQINTLTPIQIQQLSLAVIPDIPAATLAQVNDSQLALFSAQQVWALTAEQISALGSKVNQFSQTALLGLSSSQIAAVHLTATPATATTTSTNVVSQIVGFFTNLFHLFSNFFSPSPVTLPTWKQTPLLLMTASDIAHVSPEQLAVVSTSVFASLSDTQLAALTSKQILSLTFAQYEALSSAQQAKLPNGLCPAVLMTPDQIATLTLQQVQDLAPATIAGLSPAAFAALGNHIAQLTTAQISALPSALIASFSSDTWAKFSQEQLRSFAGAELGQLDNAIAGSLATQFASIWTSDQLSQLNAAQVASFTSITASNTARNVYKNALSIQTLAGFKYALSLNGVFIAKDFFALYEAQLASTKVPNKAMRLVGSAFALSAVANAFTNAALVGNNPAAITTNVLAGLTYLASALQVPINVLVTAYRAYVDAQIKGGASLTYMESLLKASGLLDSLTALRNGNLLPSTSINTPAISDDAIISTDLKNLKFSTSVFRKALASESIFVVSDLFGIANSAYGIATSQNPENAEGIAENAVNLVLGSGFLLGDLLPFFTTYAEDTGAGAATASSALASKVLGSFTIASLLIGAGFTTYKDILAYQKNPTTGNVVALTGDLIGSAAVIGITIAALAIGGPVGAIVAAAVGLLLPNFSAIGQAIDLVNMWGNFNSQGRTVWGDTVCYYFHEIAALNATPIVNLTSFVYTPTILNQLYSAMQNGGMAQALGQDLAYQMRTTSTQDGNFISKLQGLIAGAKGTPVSNIVCLTKQAVDEKDYYANSASALDNYVSVVDVKQHAFTTRIAALTKGAHGAINAPTMQDAVNLTYTDTSAGMVCVEINDAPNAPTGMTVDARSSSQAMQFVLQGNNTTVYGGSGANTYIVDGQLTGSHIYGGSSRSDVVEILLTQEQDTYFINLDFVKNAAVVASDAVARNTVFGDVAGQTYRYSAGVDNVTMLGGSGTAVVGGDGTTVTMAGGNNLVFAALAVQQLKMLPQVSTYDGGATVAATQDAQGNIVATGENTINFAASGESLAITLENSTGYSTAKTISGWISENANFKNFKNIVGSNLGDNVIVDHCSDLDTLQLGMGTNTVQVNNSSDLKVNTSAGSTNKLFVSASNVTVNSGQDYCSLLVTGGSTITAFLGGVSDVLDARNNGSDGKVMVDIQAGSQKILLDDETTQILVDSRFNNTNTVVNDAATHRTHDLLMYLGSDMAHELVVHNAGSNEIQFFSTDGSSQMLTYELSSSDALNKANHSAVQANKAAGTLSSSTISIDLLVQAMASMPSVQATTALVSGQNRTGFTLDALYAKAAQTTQIHIV